MMVDYWTKFATARITRRRTLKASASMALGAAFIAACGGNEGSKESVSGLIAKPVDVSKQAKRGGVMNFWRDREVDTSDPHATTRNAPGSISTYSRLVRRKPGYLSPAPVEFVGDLADSWELSPDKLQITFKLRTNAKWHNIAPVNGRAVDANDIVYS